MKNNNLNIEHNKNRFVLFFLIIGVLFTFAFGSANTFAKYTSEIIQRDTATVAKPVISLNCEDSVYIDGQGYLRFTISNFEGTNLSQTALLYEIRIVAGIDATVVPKSLSVALSSDYTDKTVLLSEASLIENGVYYYQNSFMKLGLSSTTLYFELVLEGLDEGETQIDVEIYAEQANV